MYTSPYKLKNLPAIVSVTKFNSVSSTANNSHTRQDLPKEFSRHDALIYGLLVAFAILILLLAVCNKNKVKKTLRKIQVRNTVVQIIGAHFISLF